MIAFDLKSVKVAMNAKAIMTPAEKAQAKLLKEFGGYCRRVMMNSIKRARNQFHHANKGKPPLYHDDGAINFKKTIFFVADVKQKNVVIGGVLLSGTKAGGDPVPGILEHGGAKFGNVRRKHGRDKYVPRTAHEHPYAGPAFDTAIKKKLPSLIAGGIMREAR
jgi:hypothetical protein